jgi:tRNA-specific 2-thiouridylase
MSRVIAVAVSGGVDSLVAAHLLKEDGWRLRLIHFLTGFERADGASAEAEDRRACGIQAIGDQLGERVHVIDASAAFHSHVIGYFSAAYRAGQTPNPCTVCNPAIKFGVVLDAALELGAESLATGHYARIEAGRDGRRRLLRGRDAEKDQSYFLFRLTQDQLRRARFPLGALLKTETRALAAGAGLRPITSGESQDACFVKGKSYRELLAEVDPEAFEPGPIEHVDGRTLGSHGGLAGFTIGQRRGINCPAAEPYYVLRLDVARNRLIVGGKADLCARSLRVAAINWIARRPEAARRVETRIRYRHTAAPSTFLPCGADAGTVVFDRPQPAVTPGQAAVFYDGTEVLGGGTIESESATP